MRLSSAKLDHLSRQNPELQTPKSPFLYMKMGVWTSIIIFRDWRCFTPRLNWLNEKLANRPCLANSTPPSKLWLSPPLAVESSCLSSSFSQLLCPVASYLIVVCKDLNNTRSNLTSTMSLPPKQKQKQKIQTARLVSQRSLSKSQPGWPIPHLNIDKWVWQFSSLKSTSQFQSLRRHGIRSVLRDK